MNTMLRNRRRLLILEQLEDRMVPASIYYDGSNLTISNPVSTPLQVTQNPSGTFTVTDGSSNNGTYRVSGSITINPSSHLIQVAVTLNNSSGSGTLPGSLTINGGNGNDTFAVNGTVGTEFIGGNLAINDGNGNQLTNIGTSAGLRVGGTTNLYGNYGNDTLNLGGGVGADTFSGNLNIHATQTIPIGNLNQAGFYTIKGGLTIDNVLKSGAAKIMSLGLGSFPTGVTVPGTLRLANTNSDTVSLGSDTVGALSINFGLNSSVTLTTSTTGTSVKGNAAIALGGTSTISIDGNAVINANSTAGNGLTLTMGAGINSYDLNNPFTVNGNVSISEPVSDTNGQMILLGATINPTSLTSTDGNLSVSLGSGNNTFTFSGSNVFGITYNSGIGDDSVTIASTLTNATRNMTFNFGGPRGTGSGSDTVDLGAVTMGRGNITVNFNAPANPNEVFIAPSGGSYSVTLNH